MGRLFALGVAGLFLWGLAGNSHAAPAFEPRPADEIEACEQTAADRPKAWAGVAQGAVGDVDWLSRVAFHRVYGAWPQADAPAQLQRLASIVICMQARLGGQPAPDPAPPPADLPIVSDMPIPGGFYRIQPGDQLLGTPDTGGVASRADKTAGVANYQASKLINDHEYNLPFRRFIEKEKTLYPQGRITFNPGFGSFAQQYADPVARAAGKGSEFAVIYIPEMV
jgi:hypothetical protein